MGIPFQATLKFLTYSIIKVLAYEHFFSKSTTASWSWSLETSSGHWRNVKSRINPEVTWRNGEEITLSARVNAQKCGMSIKLWFLSCDEANHRHFDLRFLFYLFIHLTKCYFVLAAPPVHSFLFNNSTNFR